MTSGFRMQKNDSIKTLIYIWVVLWSVNFMNKGTRIALFGGLVLFVVLICRNKKIPRSFIFMTFQVIAFGIIYTTLVNYYEDYDILRGYRDMFIPIILYLVGFLSIYNRFEYKSKITFLKNILTLSAFSLFIYGSLNLFIHLLTQGKFTYYNRYMYDIWTGSLTAATTQGSRFILMSALLPPIILSGHKYKLIYKIIVLTCVVITIAATLIMANRTLFVIMFINSLACILLNIKLNGFEDKRNIRIVVIFIFIIVLLVSLYSFDMFGVQSFYKESNFYERMQVLGENNITENSRFDAWRTTLSSLLVYPLGGSKAPIELSAPHNLWLDVAYTTGIIPFMLIISITISYIYYYKKLFKSQQINKEFKIFLTSVTVSLLLNCMVEPILGGHYILFMIFMFQLGLMHGLTYLKERSLES